MTQKDMESIVSSIKQLNGLLVVTIPDCLLYSAWQRSEQTWDTEAAGAYFGQLIASGVDGLKALEEWQGLSQLTLEMDAGLIVLRRTKGGDFAVVYLFEPKTALGWVRMQVARTYPGIEQGLGGGEDILDDEFEEPLDALAMESDAPPSDSSEAAPEPAVEPKADEAPAAPAGSSLDISMSEAAPAPAAADTGASKGARLITYLGEHTGDAHAALLRVSLQTGLPLTRLRDPDALTDEEYVKVEESVRLILGVAQLNL